MSSIHITLCQVCFSVEIGYSLTGLGPIAQLARAPRLHRGCRGFESLWAHNEEPERCENRSGFRISEGDEIVRNGAKQHYRHCRARTASKFICLLVRVRKRRATRSVASTMRSPNGTKTVRVFAIVRATFGLKPDFHLSLVLK